jgi:integrase
MRLELRYNTWHAIHDIPADVREVLGKGRRFVISLKTPDKKTAERRGAIHEARWKGEIQAARSGSRDHIDRDAEYYREALRDAGQREDTEARELILDQLQLETEERLAKAARAEGTYNDHELPDDPEAMRFYKLASGQLIKLTEHLETWLAVVGGKEKSRDQKRSTVKRFAERYPYVQDVSLKVVQQWINDLATNDGKRADTLTRYLSELRGYWKHLISLEVVPSEVRPFDHVVVPKVAREAGKEDKRQPFTSAQVVALVSGAERLGKAELADLIRLGMWTGARIEELCSLRVEHVNLRQSWFEIVDAKTKAGVRKVPIHAELKPVLKRLIGNRAEGYVLVDLSANKYEDRSPAIGHAFGRLKTALGHGPELVFHSIRKTVVTELENASVPEGVVADIVGHEKPNITFGLYSGGNSVAVMRKAIAKLKYPAPKKKAPASSR